MRFWPSILFLSLGLNLLSLPAPACDYHPKDPDKVRFRVPPSDTPDPFDPASQVSVLFVPLAVRRTEGLKAEERHPDRNDHRTFVVRVWWTVFSASTPRRVVATIEKQVQLRPPFQYVELRSGKSRRKKTFIAVDLSLAFTGRSTGSGGGAVLPTGVYPYTVEAEFIRIRETKKGLKEKEIDDTPTVAGSVTIRAIPPPVLTLTSPIAGTITRDATIKVAGTVSGGEAPLTLVINNQPPVPLTNGSFSQEFSLVDGQSTFTAVVTDAQGRTDQRTVTVSRDSVAPQVAVTSPVPGSFIQTAAPAITITYGDPAPSVGLDLATVQMFLNGQDQSSLLTIGPEQATLTPGSPLNQGSHSVVGRCRDRAGNQAEVTSTFTVDTRPPVLTAVSPTDGVTITTTTPRIDLSFSDPVPGSGLLLTSFSAVLNSRDVSNLFLVTETGASFQVPSSSALEAGAHQLDVQIADQAGGTTSIRVSFVVLLDLAPPTIVLTPSDGSALDNGKPTFTATYSDPAPSSGLNLASLEAVLDGASSTSLFTVSSASASYTPTTTLADGSHSWSIALKDRSFNAGTASASFFVDTVLPSISVQPASGVAVSVSTPTWTVTYADAEPSSSLVLGSFVASLDGQPVSFEVGPSTATFTPAAALADGLHTLSIAISDRSGNTRSVVATLFVDTVPPSVTLSPALNAVITTGTPTLVASYDDPAPSSDLDLATFVALVDGEDKSAAFTARSTQAVYEIPSGSPLIEGRHTFTARIRDHGGLLAEASSSFLVDTRYPSIQVIAPVDGAVVTTTTPELEVTFSDTSSGSGIRQGSFRAMLDGVAITDGFAVTAEGATYQVPSSSPLAPGSHLLFVAVSDMAGHESTQQVAFTVTTEPTGPMGVVVGQVITGDGCAPDPVPGATVKVVHGAGSTLTDASGRFVLPAPVGKVWLEVDKPGHLFVQRSVRVIEGRDSALPTVYLARQDAKSTHVVASTGGTVTDSTGNVTLELKPGSLPRDMDVTLTLVNDRRASKGPPMSSFIPGTGVRVTPNFVELSVPATLRVRNLAQVPVSRINAFDWNATTQQWDRALDAFVTPDGQYLETTITHFSGIYRNSPASGRGGPGPPGPPGPPPSSCGSGRCAGPPLPPVCGDCPPPNNCNNVGGAGKKGSPKVIFKTGSLVEDHDLAPIQLMGRSRTLTFLYHSDTANPEPVLSTNFAWTNPAVSGIRVDAMAGPQFSETHIVPTTGPIYHAFQWNAQDARGRKVPTGVYPISVTGHYLEPGYLGGTTTPANVEVDTEIRSVRYLGLLNNASSPFGAGWYLEELDRLVPDPTGTVLWAGGDGATTVFHPGYYTEIFAGSRDAGFSGDGGSASQARFNGIADLAYDPQGNLYVLDSKNIRVRKITPSGIVTTFAGNGTTGPIVDGGPATASPLDTPTAIATDPEGNLYIAENGRDPVYMTPAMRIRRVDASGTITTVVSTGFMDIPIPAIDDLVFDPKTNTFVTVTTGNNRVYRVGWDGSTQVLAGTVVAGYSGDNGLATEAQLNGPRSVAVGSSGEVYICDADNFRVRVVEPNGLIRTVAGTGNRDTLANEVTATLADMDIGLGARNGVALTPQGDLLIGDAGNRLIRRVDESGIIRTIAGLHERGPEEPMTAGPALKQLLGIPSSLAVGPQGQVAFSMTFDRTQVLENYVRILTTTHNGEVLYSGASGSYAELSRAADGTFTRRDLDKTVHVYSADGRKTAKRDPSGNETNYRYTTGGLLEAIVEPTGETWRFEYSGAKLVRITDHAGRTSGFNIDGNNDLIAITDTDGATTGYSYDGQHRMTGRVTAMGFPYSATYSSKGQITKALEPDGGQIFLAAQDSLALVNDLASGVGTACQPASFVRPDSIMAAYISPRGGSWRYKLDGQRQILKQIDPLGQVTEYRRNQAGQVTEEIRPNGSRILYSYLGQGQLYRQVDTGIPGAPPLEFWYSTSVTVPTTTTDRMGKITVQELNAAGQPTKIIEPQQGFTRTMTYDGRGLLVSETDRNSNRTEYIRNSSGNVTGVKYQGGATKTITHTPEGYEATVTDENGNRTEKTYTPFGLLETEKDADGNTRRMEYDADRRLIAVTDERGKRLTMEYDRHDRLVKTRSPTGRVQRRGYDEEGNHISLIDAKGREVRQEWDGLNRLTKRIQPGAIETKYEYGDGAGCASCSGLGGPLGLPTKVTDPRGNPTLYSHDGSGRTTAVTNALGGRIVLTLDGNGNVARREEPDNFATVTFYDSLNRPVATSDPRVGTTNKELDGNGNVIREINAKQQVIERKYDGRNRMIELTVAKGTPAEATTHFEYDGVGNLTVLITPNNGRWTFGYDRLNRLVRETDPNGRTAIYRYNEVSLLVYLKDRKGQETSYEYNDEGEKTGIVYHDQLRVDMAYDETGQQRSVTNGRVTIERTFDDLDRLKTERIVQLGKLLEMEYDANSNRIGFTIDGQKSTYEYDALNRLTSLAHASGAQAAWEYNQVNLLTKKTLPNGIFADLSYTSRRLMKMAYKTASGTPLASFEYTYDEIANIQTMVDEEGQHLYGHDAQNRLTSAIYPGLPGEHFRYDGNSNRIGRIHGVKNEESHYDLADQISQTSATMPPPLCPPGTPPGECPKGSQWNFSYEHDANGNLTNIREVYNPPTGSTGGYQVTTSFSYDVRDRLTEGTRADLTQDGNLTNIRTYSNEYYPDSPLRLSSTDPGGMKTQTVWDPVTQDLAQDLDAAGAVMAEYIQGTRIDDTVGMVRGGSTYAYVGDHLNSIRALVDGSGAVQNRYRYEAFGSSRLAQEGVANRLRFTAREWDPAAGTQYNRWRHYMPQIGRWTQRDPIGFVDGPNVYWYAQGNPVALSDPTGLRVTAGGCCPSASDCETSFELGLSGCTFDLIDCIRSGRRTGKSRQQCVSESVQCRSDAKRRYSDCMGCRK